MNTPLFPGGITGLADTKWSGSKGNAHKLVGVDFRSEPGVIKAQQKLKKISSTFVGEVETNVVTELCNNSIELSNGNKLWFSSESGKIWQQTGDTFALVHTIVPATDYDELDSLFVGVEEPDYTATLSILENDYEYGTITQLNSTTADANSWQGPSILQLNSSWVVVAYGGGVNQSGFIKTYNVNYLTGTMSLSDTLEHDIVYSNFNSLVKIDDTHVMLAYSGDGDDGYIKVFTIDGAGNITQNSSLEFDITAAYYCSLTKIDATHYMLAYKNTNNDGYFKIFTIDGTYAFTETSSLEFEGDTATWNSLLTIDSTHFIIAYTGSGSKGYIKTFSIDGAYAITQIDSLEHDAGVTSGNCLLALDSTHYALSYISGANGYVKIFTIDGSYDITQTASFNYETNISANQNQSLIRADDNHLVVAYTGPNTDGYIKTLRFDNSYTFTELYSLEQDTSLQVEAFLLKGLYSGILLGYQGSSGGVLKTFEISQTYSIGGILNPSGSALPEVIASTSESDLTSSSTISATIDVPVDSNMEVVVIAGCMDDIAITGITFGGSAMTQVVGNASSLGFENSNYIYRFNAPTSGSKSIVVTFASAAIYRYVNVIILKGVNQTTPFSATTDKGWKDYLTLPGASSYQLRIGSFITMAGDHNHGILQNKILERDISDVTIRGTVSVATRGYKIGTAKTLSAIEFSYTQNEQIGTIDNDYEYKPEKEINKIYYCNEEVLFAIAVDKISDWVNSVETIGNFYYGDNLYHSMVKQNLELFIGDNLIIAKVDTNGNFVQETSFNVKSPERIQALATFDIDILIGTIQINKSRVLRWDGLSDSWSAEDDIFEKGINAFIKDDNYTYVSAGEYGRLYFYNGEKLELYKRIPGTWDSTHKAVINPNATDFYMGNPVFGLSNSTGNATLQGVYGLGSYDSKYEKSLSLDYPLPTKEFDGVTIGAILVNGADMFISYKTATDVGVARIDHSNKYTPAYIETMQLTSLQDRDTKTIEEGICVDYVSLPTNTDVDISYKTKYDTAYTAQNTIVDTDTMSIKTDSSIPDINSLQLRFDLISVGNNCPVVENLGIL